MEAIAIGPMLWARSAVRSVLTGALRMPKKGAPPPKTDQQASKSEPVRDTSQPGDTIPGLNYFKTGKDPVIKEDSEYPEWLWKIIEPMVRVRACGFRLGSGAIYLLRGVPLVRCLRPLECHV